MQIKLKNCRIEILKHGKTDITWKFLHCSSVSLIIDDNADWYIKISIDEGFSSTSELRDFVLNKLVTNKIILRSEKRKILIISEL